MEDNEYAPTVNKYDAYILAVSTLVQLQELSNTTYKVISDMLTSIKDGGYFEKLTRSKLIEKN